MPRLGRFVALAGKNGAGKTRILETLEALVITRSSTINQVEQIKASINSYKHTIELNPGHSSMPQWTTLLAQDEARLSQILDRVIGADDVTNFRAIKFVPKQLNLQDPGQFPTSQLQERFTQAKSPGLVGYENNCLFYIQHLQARYWNVEHPLYSGSPEDKESAIEDYKSFKDIIDRLLGTTLDRDLDSNPTLFGKPISKVGLSDGQKIILQLCVALHAQRSGLDNTVFLLDEPENHLHPSAVIDLVKSLYETTKTSQIWIATHSVPLLSYVASIDPMCLWYVDDGKATHAGRRPELVLGSLLGNEEQIAQLNSFTSLPAQLAAINYANESLLPPKVISEGGKDPQVSQIQRIIAGLGNGTRLAVLDVGAGKGRLLDGLGEEVAAQGSRVDKLIDYFAYDLFPDDRAACEQVIRSHFPDGVRRYFNSRDDFFSHKDNGSISVVVMCNVLHEIPPHEWLDLFSSEKLIYRSLKDDGYLLLVEDQRIPVGEKAHQFGFVVLDTSHLKTLFDVKAADIDAGSFIVDDARNDGRLKGHLIAKGLLSRVTPDTRRNAIKQLNDTAKDNIKSLRTGAPSYANGQLHGFWTQQFANSSLYLSEA
ncbi:AAA family ATPase [Burkholderia sp. AU31624]|uniref:AAA family ATPase n=1 Tax=Burkholderia sp. AU31624 TaxID=2879629 RepID=UPI001CF1064E|nr:AAA family ATPase [Burkholderia sp. AU31624]MCA8256269.1 AAA family ATPase [Burkholderia sp. AU31624]